MKKNFTKIIVLSIMFLGMMMWTSATKAQTYQTILWDNYAGFANVPYCTCDSIKCVPPAGATSISWSPMLTQHGDTLVLCSGFNGQVDCFYTLAGIPEAKSLSIRPILAPVQPTFINQNICGIQTVILDAENHSTYGFTTYAWSTGASTQTITVGAGSYQVTVSNACGQISRPVTIVENNSNQPNLGPDITPCQGSTVVLDPGTGYNNYLWIPGNSTDSTLSPTTSGTYVVQTTNTVGGCVDRDTITITFLVPPVPEIKNISTQINQSLPGYGNNVVLWDSLAYPALETINVYVDGILDGSTQYINGKMTLSVSSVQSGHLIRIAGIDTCGNISQQSSYVKSNHAYASQGVPSGVNVGWDGIEFEGAKSTVQEYHVWKSDSFGNYTMVGSVGGSFNSFTDPSGGGVIYIVGAIIGSKDAMQTEYLSNLVSNNVGISEQPQTVELEVYPNPATDGIYIQSDENVINIDVTDLTGRIILSGNEKNINISSISSGTYLIKVTTQAGKIGYQKFIKQ